MIESLHSPHIARVKALISSRGNKERAAHGEFIAEGLQCAREAFTATSGPTVKTIYVTESCNGE
jgi:TrmH family RNA methyltransferase